MATIPADSRAFIKPFEGIDVTCLVSDVVAWFGADEICSILCLNTCQVLKNLPYCEKALWKEIEPCVDSEKIFITSLGVRLLIAKSLEVEVNPRRRRSCRCKPNRCKCRRSPSPPRRRRSSQCRRSPSPRRRSPSPNESLYYYNTLCDRPSTHNHHHHHHVKFDITPKLHKLGNVFINEAIYDLRAYHELDEINCKINRIYDILTQPPITTPITVV
ncbi:hypothetical protein SlGVgp015 [Spodoptera litura granulovirus]|uniref:Baculovirus polyhedron envelope protein PEP N-terminal domain-containing protein n=1 Tax=Spodoptera litura granulovirus TaxID=359919 RepID=A5IZL7_9BBAC|nr:hypothetical protein SlGVgp015 [Spodoptera litura granulovirus]ABQ51958.1 hypothetical protein SlGVgp015 [Spodoptera litura granulovirus]